MMRRILVILSLLLSLLILASCHGQKDALEITMPDDFDPNKQYEIVFWAKNENNSNQRDVYEQAIAEFESYYPNISVTIKHFVNYDDIYNDVITNIQTGTTPNVCITYPDHIATYITGEGVVYPLDRIIDDPKWGLGGSQVAFDAPRSDEMIEKYLEEGYIGDTLYALPYMRSTEALYINKTYVEALGYEIPDVLTWDFVWEVSAAALKKDSNGNYAVNGQSVMIPFIYKSTDNMMIQMLRQLDAGYSTVTGQIEMFNDSSREILKHIASQSKLGTFSTFKISSYPANYLNRGQCIFAVDSTAGSTWMGSDAPLSDVHHGEVVDFETVVRPVPQYDVENPAMISQGPSLCIFNKEDSGEVMASWLFVQYLLSNNTQIAYSQTEGYVPVTLKAQNSNEYQDYLNRAGEDNELYYDVKIATTKMLIENTENTFTAPVFNGSVSLRNAAGEMIEDVTKAVKRKKIVNDKYIDKLYESVTSLYRLDQIEASEGKIRLGRMPALSIALLCGIGVAWLGIITYFGVSKLKNRNGASKRSLACGSIDAHRANKIKSALDLVACETCAVSVALIIDCLAFINRFASVVTPIVLIAALVALSALSLIARRMFISKYISKKREEY